MGEYRLVNRMTQSSGIVSPQTTSNSNTVEEKPDLFSIIKDIGRLELQLELVQRNIDKVKNENETVIESNIAPITKRVSKLEQGYSKNDKFYNSVSSAMSLCVWVIILMPILMLAVVVLVLTKMGIDHWVVNTMVSFIGVSGVAEVIYLLFIHKDINNKYKDIIARLNKCENKSGIVD